uniref:ATP-dependent RNA helicase n=1 Tax=Caenorhabditis tropicalis TaxID=1561998 RepID=A0A1I7ULQ3_9PELO
MKRKVKEEEEMEVDEEENEEIKEEDEENGVEKDENNEEAMPDSSSTVAPEDRDVFKVLGKQEMKNLEALKITSSWVQNATTFSATIDASTSESLSSIEIPSFLQIPSTISSWFPVQNAVLPSLISQIQAPPPLRPRDVAIAAPTGSGKTIYSGHSDCRRVQGVITQLVTDALSMNAAQDWEDVSLFTPYLNDQALMYDFAECLAVQTFLRMTSLPFNVRQRPNVDFISPDGVIPLLKINKTLITGFNAIVDFVHKKGVTLTSHLKARLLASDPPNVIVATPARLAHHLTSEIPPPIDLSKLRFLIVDEADRMGKLMREEWMDLVEFLCGGMERVGCLNDILRQRRAPQKIL